MPNTSQEKKRAEKALKKAKELEKQKLAQGKKLTRINAKIIILK